jgi:nucleotide-binding universal stress UspA family protein/mono/diheme cytochrome c family protein
LPLARALPLGVVKPSSIKDRIMTLDIARILVPLDFSDNSIRALEYAQALARKFGASLHLVHVCEMPSIFTASMDAYAIAYNDWSQRLGEEAERELVKAAARITDARVTTEVLFGNPARAIVEAAMVEHADLVVMGTHGHGAVLHVVLGNVAERVVRNAPCPVLTVREPRARELKKASGVRRAAFVPLVFAGLMLAAAPAAAQEPEQTQTVPGSAVFQTYCASCHGTSARGDGTLAASMTRKPANLTEIAKRNGGEFPRDLVYRTIDGRQPVRGHGGPDMPVWGDAFKRSRDGGDEERIKRVIASLVDYLESIQLRPTQQ